MYYVYIYEKGYSEINWYIWFWDYLWIYFDIVKEYEMLKIELVYCYCFESEKYVENKMNFIYKIDVLVLKWRKGSSNKNRKDDFR